MLLPASIRKKTLLLNYYAKVAGHPGLRKLYKTLRLGYYWTAMGVDFYRTMRQCSSSAKNRILLYTHTSPLKLFLATEPLSDVSIDILGPLPKTKSGNRFLLVIADRFTKLCRVVPLRLIRAHEVAKAFTDHWVFAYGAPIRFFSDKGPQSASKLYQECCRILETKWISTATYHTQTNGQVERMNRTLSSMLKY